MTQKIIPLYKKRTFGEKVSATFDFLTGNLRLWLQCCLYLFLPLSLFQGIALNGLFGSILDVDRVNAIAADTDFASATGFLASYLGYILFMVIGSLLLSSLMYAMIRRYKENNCSLEGVTLRDMAPQIKANFWRGLRAGLLLALIFLGCLVLLGITVITIVLPILIFVALVAVAVPMSLTFPVCMFEDGHTAWETLRRAFRLGWHTWGGTFLLSLVMGLIGNIIQGFLSLPWYIVMMVKMVFEVDGTHSDVTGAAWFSFLYYLLAVLQAFGTYLALSFSVTALAYQYGSAAEEMDSVSVDEDIDNFETI